jgi:hypothetical protein
MVMWITSRWHFIDVNTLCVISRQFSTSIAATLTSRLFHWCCLIFGWCKSVLIIWLKQPQLVPCVLLPTSSFQICGSLGSLLRPDPIVAPQEKPQRCLMVHIVGLLPWWWLWSNLKIERGTKVRKIASWLHYKPQNGTYLDPPTSWQCCDHCEDSCEDSWWFEQDAALGLASTGRAQGTTWSKHILQEPIWKTSRDFKLAKRYHDCIKNHQMELT